MFESVGVGDAVVSYRVDGGEFATARPPLLLVHGTGADGEGHFGHLLGRFGDRMIVRPDLSGSGSTVDGGGALSVGQLANEVVAVAASVSDGPVDIVGYSLGAVVAAAAAASFPGRVRRLVLVAGWLRPDARQDLVLGLWRKLADLDPTAYAEFTATIGFSPGFLAHVGREGIANALAATVLTPGTLRQLELNLRADISETVGAIVAPTLVIGCTQDQLIPVHHSRQLAAATPGSVYTEIDCGHLVLFEQPSALLAAVNSFLA
jgi:pimeloyl-ACP methyl ester carboxylesterase